MPLDPNLVGMWLMDDGSGTTLTDHAGSNNGTLNNMEAGDWVTVSGQPALQFGGTDEYVLIPAPTALQSETSWAVAFWASASSSVVDRAALSIRSGDTSSDMWLLYPFDTISGQFNVRGSYYGTSFTETSNTTDRADGTLHLFVFSQTSATSWKVYLDNGTEIISGSTNLALGASNLKIGIGAWYRDAGVVQHFVGAVGPVYIFNRSLSQSEVQSLWADPTYFQGLLSVGMATETDSAQKPSLAHPRTIGTATSTNTAFSLFSNAKLIATGRADETDTAFIRLAKLIKPSDSGNITIAWDANTEPDLAGYNIYIGTTTGEYIDGTLGNYTFPLDVGNVTTYTFFELPRPATYFFAITAYDSVGNESDFSNEIEVDFGPPASAETDTAIPLSRGKVIAVGTATETDSALAPLTRLIPAALETDTALALSKVKIRSHGFSTETDTAFALIESPIRFIGSAVETDEAFAPAITKITATGSADETDVALALTGTKFVVVTTAVEEDEAFSTYAAVHYLNTGRANEADTAFVLVATKLKAVGMAAETDTAVTIARAKILTVGVAAETDTAVTVTRSKNIATGRANETDSAFSRMPSVKTIVVTMCLEYDIAANRFVRHNLLDYVAIEIDTALAGGGEGGEGGSPILGTAYRKKRSVQRGRELVYSTRR